MARTLADIKKSHGPRDHAAELKKALAGVPAGQYETTKELAKRAGLAQQIVGPLHEKFPAHTVQTRGPGGKMQTLWARTPADATKLRDALKSQNG
jgi:hypothetical protein